MKYALRTNGSSWAALRKAPASFIRSRTISESGYLTNQLLIAMPAMGDPNFAQTVALVCDHSSRGALGLILNKPLPMRMGEIFEQLEIDLGKGPEEAIVALGYAGWDGGQLEDEIRANAWLSAPVDPGLIFELPFESRWLAAGRLLGVELSRISPISGNA